MQLFTRAWWRETILRIAATILAALLPLAAQIPTGEVSVRFVGSVAAFAGLGALIFALVHLPGDESLPLWKAILYRAVRTAAQTLGAALAGYKLIEEVPWSVVLVTVAGAVLTTVLRTVLSYLPEAVPSGDDED